MRTCERHSDSIIVFNGDVCPLCKAEERLRTVGEEIEKSMKILLEIKASTEGGGAGNLQQNAA